MTIDRRNFLATTASLGLAGWGNWAWPTRHDANSAGPWHPLTQSLLDRAGRASTRRIDTSVVQSEIARMAEVRGLVRVPVVKWLASPADVVACLAEMELDVLLETGTASFWRFNEPLHRQLSDDEDSTCRLRSLAARLVKVEHADRELMEPKRRVKAAATAASASAESLFRVRAVLAQIGWLETSLAAMGVQAICDVQSCLQEQDIGAAEDFVRRRLIAFEAWEAGLLATWETPSEMICVARIA